MATGDVNYDPTVSTGGVTLTAGQLAGRGASSGTGTEEAITLGTNLSMSGTTLNANAGSGAPSGAQYLTLALDAGLSAERVATATARVTITDSGANGTATFDLGTASVADSYLADMTARSLKGRSANSTGVPGTISGGGAGTYASDNATSVAFRAVTDIIQNLNLSGDLSPAQITASQDDYNPTNLATASILRLDLDAARSITGIAGGADGRVLGLINLSAFTLTLTDASTSSSAANRFDFNGDLALGSKHGAVLWYDSTSSRWRLLSRAFPFTAVPSTRTITAGAGLTGTGDLSADRTLAVGANADGTITVNADDIQVGTLIAANIPAGLVANSKLANMAALTVKANATNGAAAPADLAAASDGQVLRRNGTALEFALLTDANIATANKDGASATASMRTLGTGAAQACAGNDSRLSDSRAPTGSAGGDLTGTYPNPTIGTNKVANSQFRQGAARSVVGVTGNATANVADIAGGGAGTVLFDNGTTVGFGFLPPTVSTLTDAATVVVDAALIAHGGSFDLTISGNRTMGAPSNPVNGKVITFAIRQNAGSNTITWNAVYRWTTTVTVPTLSTGAGKTDYVAFRYNGTDSKWDALAVDLAP